MKFYKSIFITLIFFSISITSDDVEGLNGCKTKLAQVMRPEYPRVNYQGFALIKFNIEESGKVTKTRVVDSSCAMTRNKEGDIEYKKCPYFKQTSIAASKYLMYKPPLDDSGRKCSITDHSYKYNYVIYRDKVNGNKILLREEFQAIQ